MSLPTPTPRSWAPMWVLVGVAGFGLGATFFYAIVRLVA